jgi:hypothetical protein
MSTRILPEEERDWNGGTRSKRTKVKSSEIFFHVERLEGNTEREREKKPRAA